MMRAIPREIRLGTKAFLKPLSGKNHDHVRFPRAKAIAPKYIS